AKARSGGGDDRTLDVDERAELGRLRRENSELRVDREFLKEAAAFFASEQNRGRRLPADRLGEGPLLGRSNDPTARGVSVRLLQVAQRQGCRSELGPAVS
ncbi:putative transposase, partial [Gordonia paraffinivorans NBRC 108238]